MSERNRFILLGAAGGLLLGVLSAFFSPAGMKNLVAMGVRLFLIVGLTGLGALFGNLEYNARKTRAR